MIARVNMRWLTSNRAGRITLNTVGRNSLATEEKAGLTDSSYRRHGQNYFNKYIGSQALLMEHPDFAQLLRQSKTEGCLSPDWIMRYSNLVGIIDALRYKQRGCGF